MAGTVICDYINSANVSGGFLGIGQTWQNKLSSRSASVTYTNTTNKPIMVFVSTISTINSYIQTGLTIVVDGLECVCQPSNGDLPAGNASSGVCVIVPVGSTYTVLTSNSNIIKWNELAE